MRLLRVRFRVWGVMAAVAAVALVLAANRARETEGRRAALERVDMLLRILPDSTLSSEWVPKVTEMRRKLIVGESIPSELEPINEIQRSGRAGLCQQPSSWP